MYTDRVVWYDDKGSIIDSYEWRDSALLYCYSNANLALCITGENETYIDIIGASSDRKLSIPIHVQPTSIQWHKGFFYLIGEDRIEKIDYQGKHTILSVSPGLIKLVFLPNGEIMGCYADHTEMIVFENN
jgi:hypothetical protein